MIKEKFKEVLATVLPISLLVVILNFTVVPLESDVFIRFLLGAVFILLGLTIFLIGVDLGITPMGDSFGNAAVKSGKLWVIALMGLILGFVISIAEPDLHIFADQVGQVTLGVVSKSTLVMLVSMGVALLISLGMLSNAEFGEVQDIAVASEAGIFSHFIHEAPIVAKEIIIALLPIIVIYTICNMIFFHNSKRANVRVATGCVLTFVGLVIFLVGVNSGFMDVGRYIGHVLATEHSKAFIVAIAFLMGVLTILAEPAVHVLTKQIEA